MTMVEKTNEEFAQSLASGLMDAAEELVLRLQGEVYALSYSILENKQDAEDATQETFVKMIEKISQYDTKERFSPWLFRIAVNAAYDMLKKKRPRSFLDKEQGVADISSSPVDIISQDEDIANITSCIEKLPQSLKIVMALKYREGLNNEEIRKILDISQEALRVRLFRAKSAIRKALKKGEKNEM